MSKTNTYNTLKYSIRQCGEDEIEIRNAFFDGYSRGFIRLLFIGIFCMSWYQNAKYNDPPFSIEMETIKEDFIWAFNSDKEVRPLYDRYLTKVTQKDFLEKYPNTKIDMYEEYKDYYLEKTKWNRIRAYLHPIWISFLLFLFFLPRPRGIRVNRKKRIIYAPILNGTYRVAFVPKEGDPLGGVVYSCYGTHPWGGDSLYSFVIGIREEHHMQQSRHYLGVYPSITSKQSIDILHAIRAYLTEDDPEFLKHIKRRFSVWHYIATVPFCNAFAIPVPFKRAKADAAIEKALAEWNKKTNNQKQKWFKQIAEEQRLINEEYSAKGLDNYRK
ncbi:hypothetical protein D3M79_07495 [Rodentibacter pneumotropicus]|uniref:hypothetical protein n=1 Tax=Rodentibacter pneumotropicus TaxID=758 RepID=UPI00109D3D32|nr:hypothetical protein [Rodentibacter pneumotropicus]TGZ98886.1 hypothetical protein D3M74_10260 [Rodentibacter pneumotropicus]TGZ99037.1 hypothetical protein D3M79_07495 [Rodentibacter pneumotropicus]THA04098.1 hypothetical protein D3M77_11145 [Rodentibacter pneumotropicus]